MEDRNRTAVRWMGYSWGSAAALTFLATTIWRLDLLMVVALFVALGFAFTFAYQRVGWWR